MAVGFGAGSPRIFQSGSDGRTSAQCVISVLFACDNRTDVASNNLLSKHVYFAAKTAASSTVRVLRYEDQQRINEIEEGLSVLRGHFLGIKLAHPAILPTEATWRLMSCCARNRIGGRVNPEKCQALLESPLRSNCCSGNDPGIDEMTMDGSVLRRATVRLDRREPGTSSGSLLMSSALPRSTSVRVAAV